MGRYFPDQTISNKKSSKNQDLIVIRTLKCPDPDKIEKPTHTCKFWSCFWFRSFSSTLLPCSSDQGTWSNHNHYSSAVIAKPQVTFPSKTSFNPEPTFQDEFPTRTRTRTRTLTNSESICCTGKVGPHTWLGIASTRYFCVRHRVQGLTRSVRRPEMWALPHENSIMYH
jgi:hypothetical protein